MDIILLVMYKQGVKEFEFILLLFKQLVPNSAANSCLKQSVIVIVEIPAKEWLPFCSQLASCAIKMSLP